jgi:hypothetical protein
MWVKNTEAFVVNIGGTLVIPPLGKAEVDERHGGIARLLRQGVLTATEADEVDEADDGQPGDQGPQTVAKLKQALDDLQIGYPDNARKPELQALYEQALYEQAKGQ